MIERSLYRKIKESEKLFKKDVALPALFQIAKLDKNLGSINFHL